MKLHILPLSILLKIVLFLLLLAGNEVHVPVLLKFATQYYFSNRLEMAGEKLQQIYQMDPNNADARILEALILIRRGDVDSRIRARELLEKYTVAAKNKILANFAQGFLLKQQNNRSFAAKYFKKAIDQDPNFLPAYLELGELYYLETLEYLNRVTDTSVPLSFRQFAIEDYDRAVHYLTRALQLDPTNEKALFLLGLLYYETNHIQEMLELYLEAIRYHSQNANFYFFAGLGYHLLGNSARAAFYFEKGLHLTPPDQRRYFQSPDLFAADTASQGSKEYWASLDPLLLTPENERLLEHYARVAYANLRFAVPELDIPGWKTDRGQVYIRYGKPKHIVRIGRDVIPFDGVYPATEIWQYDDKVFTFEDEFWNGNFRFAQPSVPNSRFKSRSQVDFQLAADEYFRIQPQQYAFSLPGGSFEVIYDFYTFKGSDGRDDVWIIYGIPTHFFMPLSNLRFDVGVFFWIKNPVDRHQVMESFELNKSILQKYFAGRLMLNQLQIKLPPEEYWYSMEIVEKVKQKMFVDRKRLKVPRYDGLHLQMSDLVLAFDIEMDNQSSQFVRRGLHFTPNITAEFVTGQKMFIYFEVYNLWRNDQGQTMYRVANTLVSRKKKGFLAKLFGGSPGRVTLINEYSGKAADDYVLQTIDLSDVDPGDYELEIEVTDLLKNFSEKKVKEIKIHPNN